MTAQQWKVFSDFRQQFKNQCDLWNLRLPNLMELQKKAALDAGTPEYSFENPVVYNTDLDKITPEDDVRLIVIGDNPGKDEQLNKNQKYLVGQAGKIAEGYFKRNGQLGIDFRKNVIILNKTPVHSAKTNQLKKMLKDGGADFEALLEETQVWMAQKTAELHQKLCEFSGAGLPGVSDLPDSDAPIVPELWLVGYSELKQGGIFSKYRETLKSAYNNEFWEKVFVFQHFSMNRFSIDLNDFIVKNSLEAQSLEKSIHEVGKLHKQEIFLPVG